MSTCRNVFPAHFIAFCVVCGARAATAENGHNVPALRWSAYLTTGSVQRLAHEADAARDAPEILRGLNITKVYLEFFRGAEVKSADIIAVRDALRAEGFLVSGGIATVPGPDGGVRQEGGLDWLNWQDSKTREDIAAIMRRAAPLFDEIIVDDFFCTGDEGPLSVEAKGERTWSEYRRALMVKTAKDTIIAPARSTNPDIQLIIKYPQWYDRFHEFGYDVAAKSELFDRIWVGTETRGANTQRYGFVQPYEGFVNFRWLASIGKQKTGGAWFDHGDCDADDFIEQAYQSVLAGAREIILFSYAALEDGHPGHNLLRDHQPRLEALSAEVRVRPVTGVAAYKPANSDPGPDLFIMDYVGMLGIPLVPVSTFPADSQAIFLPTQAAFDPDIAAQLEAAVKHQANIVLTAGFLAAMHGDARIRELAGARIEVPLTPIQSEAIIVDDVSSAVQHGLDLAGQLEPEAARVVLTASAANGLTPFLTVHSVAGARIWVLNVRTFSVEDYRAVGEVLLPPRPLGLLELPRQAVNIVRKAFYTDMGISLDAPARIVMQPFGPADVVLHNYTALPQDVRLNVPIHGIRKLRDRLGENEVPLSDGSVSLTLPPRSRVWLAPTQ